MDPCWVLKNTDICLAAMLSPPKLLDEIWGAGVPRWYFFKHSHVAYQIDGYDKQSRVQVKFSSYGQTGDLGVRSKVKYH